MATQNSLNEKQREDFLALLKDRFEKNKARHENIDWPKVQKKLMEHPEKILVLYKMEQTGGEPDVIGEDGESGEIIFCDCSEESPKGRRSTCYDRKALESRSKNKPQNTAVDMAAEIGIEILTEEEYRELQKKGKFDLKTSSWIRTPSSIRELGGALFCDRRYDHIFVYHNGAESYYGSRGFRGSVRV